MTIAIFVAQVNIGLKVVIKESSQDLPKETWEMTTNCVRGTGHSGGEIKSVPQVYELC